MWVCIWQLGEWYGENHWFGDGYGEVVWKKWYDDVDFKIQQAVMSADINDKEASEENLFIQSEEIWEMEL